METSFYFRQVLTYTGKGVGGGSPLFKTFSNKNSWTGLNVAGRDFP